ncbi:angiopoietin-related protein 7-like [Culex pipiens pallens]|uniref:angiopoietin-related protein 7-like n=1 Tax=Culex pipiens pallens TaxID=42434 RepID=UPI0022AAB256|nr:angiopoietin-related protein 7-like [Culex pipiens pallens]
MRRIVPSLALLVLLVGSSSFNFVSAADFSNLNLEEQILEIQQKLEELFSTRNKRLEEITAENHQLRQTVETLSWEASLLDRSLNLLENGHSIVERNVSRVSGQFDNTMAHQQFCARDGSSQDLLDDYYLSCGSLPSSPLPPSTTEATTSETTVQTTTSENTVTTTEDPSAQVYRSCDDAPPISGVYRLVLESGTEIQVFCEQQLMGGGWLVFQSRLDGSVDFNRSWSDYRNGFGDASGEYWLGLEHLVELTSEWSELLIDMEDFERVTEYALYPHFAVEDATANYRLRLGGIFEGTAGDSLGYYYNERFSTYDSERLTSHAVCAETLASGFWHYSCGDSLNRNNLNGIYGHGHNQKGIWWGTFGGSTTQNRNPLKAVRMMIRNHEEAESFAERMI